MDPSPALDWDPPKSWTKVVVVDSHTGGEPFRVVIEGLPHLPGSTVLEKRRHAIEHHDHLRRALMWEPRGHADMYGGWIGPPVRPGSHLSVLFMHNEGFSTMCGHGIIALTKVMVDTGVVSLADGVALSIDTPAGLVTATPTMVNGSVGAVSFVNVPSFVKALDQILDLEGLGTVRYDLAYGGAFYAYVDVGELGLSLDDPAPLISAGRKVKQAILSDGQPSHPEDPELGFLYGVVFHGPPTENRNHSRHVCVFADGEVDRSPTGTGVSGRLAILHARGEADIGDSIAVESIVGSVFSGRILSTSEVGDLEAIVPEITGEAHLLGRYEMWLDPDDTLGTGFILR